MSARDGWDFLNSDDGYYKGEDSSWGYTNSDGSGYYSGSDGSWGYKESDGSGYYSGSDGSWGYMDSEGNSYYSGSNSYSSSGVQDSNNTSNTEEAIASLGEAAVNIAGLVYSLSSRKNYDNDNNFKQANNKALSSSVSNSRKTINQKSQPSLFCIECGGPISINSKFCPTCGRKITLFKTTCKQCGHTLRNAAKFCSMCGCPVEQS